MDLNEIKEYSHKVKTIRVTNKNRYSLYNNVILKVTVSSSDDEIIRFSLNPNDNFIDHQQIKDDYYCSIPNKLNDKITLYIHFFPTDLYDYEMLKDLVSEHTLEELIESATITSNRYEQKFNNDGELIVQSTDEESVTHYHDPNYKNYTKVTPTINQTEKGQFPLSSKYRSSQNWKVPNLNDPNPQWQQTNNEAPYWQARIPFSNLDVPINVFVNYEYLPTSREYHQHYFGFEPTNIDNTTINIFEGTNINQINDAFGSNNNYRLINLGNTYDDSYSIFVPHENTIPINMDFYEKYYDNEQSCSWTHHPCKDYYVYTPYNTSNNQLGYCYQDIDLISGNYYSLQYYIYIPSKATVTTNSCYIAINVDGIDYKINEAFIIKDKELRNQWIYHEVPFLAGENNKIKIVGPQGSTKTNNYEDSIFFIYLEMKEMIKYSPTLQYGSTGLRITEQDKSILKPPKNQDVQTATILSDKQYQPTPKNFPKPYSDINIITKNEKYIYYDPYTTDLIYVHNIDNNNAFYYDKTTGELHIPGDEDIEFRYDEDTSDLYMTCNKKLTGIYGPNNSFTFDFITNDSEYVTDGEVEISILTQKDQDINNKGMIITRTPKKVTGSMTFNNVDLSNLQPNTSISNAQNKYYIRLLYTNKCMELIDKPKIIFKSLYVYKEDIRISIIKVNETALNINTTTHKVDDYSIDNIEQLPLKISIQIIDQNGGIKTSGYCELSINEKMNQTTLVDTNGWADFYLAQDDLIKGKQTIKIEFYRKYNNPLAFIYFDIINNLESLGNYIPIDIKILENGMTKAISNNNTYEIESDDCVLSVINTHEYEKFRIEVYRNDQPNTPIIRKNINTQSTEDISFIHATLDEWATHDSYTYKIITGNMINKYGNVIQDLYNDYERSFTIIKKHTT